MLIKFNTAKSINTNFWVKTERIFNKLVYTLYVDSYLLRCTKLEAKIYILVHNSNTNNKFSCQCPSFFVHIKISDKFFLLDIFFQIVVNQFETKIKSCLKLE